MPEAMDQIEEETDNMDESGNTARSKRFIKASVKKKKKHFIN